MRQFAGACRFVYNKALALQQENHKAGEKFIGYVPMAKRLTEWRNGADTPWLKDGPVHTQQCALKAIERAYVNFFEKRADFPRFKRKGMGDGFTYPDKKQIKLDRENGRVFLPKLGYMRLRKSRDVVGEVRSATVSLRAGKWYVSILAAREVETPVPHGPAVGIDVGVARFATMSDGSFIAPLASFRKHEKRLAKYQRRMARKVKGSSNWKKAKSRIQRIHARIADARADFLHKAHAPSPRRTGGRVLYLILTVYFIPRTSGVTGSGGPTSRRPRDTRCLNTRTCSPTCFDLIRKCASCCRPAG
jgi:putative transposase